MAEVDQIGHDCRCAVPVHVYLDTGMCRSGMGWQQAEQALVHIRQSRHLRLAGVYSHLATADMDPTVAAEQARELSSFLDQNQAAIGSCVLTHIANTYATLRERSYHLDLVRVGQGILGYGDTLLQGEPRIDGVRPLWPVVRWLSRINHVQRYPKGAYVGYARTHRLERDSELAVVSVGHADGYPQALANRSKVRVMATGQGAELWAPVVGQVSMDQMVIDLTAGVRRGQGADTVDLKALGVGVGSVVELVSDDPASACSLPHLAGLAGTSCYELLCRLSPRLPRCYVSTDQPGSQSMATGAGQRTAIHVG